MEPGRLGGAWRSSSRMNRGVYEPPCQAIKGNGSARLVLICASLHARSLATLSVEPCRDNCVSGDGRPTVNGTEQCDLQVTGADMMVSWFAGTLLSHGSAYSMQHKLMANIEHLHTVSATQGKAALHQNHDAR